MTNRIHIDAPAGVVEIEGEKDFVEGLLPTLMPLLEGIKFGGGARAGVSYSLAPDPDSHSDPDDGGEEEKQKPKAKRRKTNVPPKGQSCAARVLTLKDEGFFKEHRTSGEIVDALAKKGWTHNTNQVSAALSQMFPRGEIQRTKDGGRYWKYYWDRD